MLQGLFLQFNALPDRAMDMIAKLPALENLGMRSSGISDFSRKFTGDSRLLDAKKRADEVGKVRRERKVKGVIKSPKAKKKPGASPPSTANWQCSS